MMKEVSNILNQGLKIGSLNIKQNIKHISNIKHSIYRTFTYFLLLNMVYIFLFPFLYMIANSIKSINDLYDLTINWVPRSIELKNYIIAFKTLEYPRFFINSFIITASSTIGHLLACSFIGYGFARYNFIDQKIFFPLVILSIIIPIQTIIMPQYMIFSNLRWINTYLPIIVPTFFGYGLKGGLFIFIYRQFYLGLPTALEEASRIDGCGFIRTYWQIIFPITKSALLVTLVLSIVWHWNDFYEPSLYIGIPELSVLPSRLNVLVSMVSSPPRDMLEMLKEIEQHVDTESAINNAVLMAGTFLVTLPVLISFGFLQRKFMSGIERTGLVE